MSIFQGTGVAIITPFTTKGSVDFEALGNHVERLIDNGINYLVILGTTGEAVTLNPQEQHDVIRFIIERADGRVPAVIGMGGNNTGEVVAKIKRTDFQGIQGILSVAPYYNKPSQEGLYQAAQVLTLLLTPRSDWRPTLQILWPSKKLLEIWIKPWNLLPTNHMISIFFRERTH